MINPTRVDFQTLLLSKKRRLETITIEVGDCFIASSPCIRYLGLQLDARLTFDDHLRAASEEASRVAGALSQIMPTIGGPRSSRRRLYANVIDSILLYGAPIWSCGTRTRAGMRRAEAIHRRACLRVISGRPHLSYDATYVLASIPPLALLADERSRLYQRRHEDARAEERQETLRRWQSRWDRSSKGRWTHRLIPNVRSWIERRHGEVDNHLTQLLTGHSYFKHHSQRYDHNASADCPVCPNTVEDAEHVFFNCIRFVEGREKLHRQLQDVARPENIVQLMLADEKNWLAVATFAHSVITSLRAEEMAKRR
uniref:Reverse transcriptase zinc-binding domain-containing protein n=1 Tax=Trichogramma kaykai TaxID=54128 RepID=A0ABD2WEA4_9HYME